MAEREIKTRLKLEGESEFRKGMRDSASAVKVLNSEEKLAEAQFKLTGDQEKYLTEKTEILKKKIEEQQKAVKTAEEALAKMKKQGFDPNSKAVQDWTIKLNSSKAQLTRMQGDLAATQRGLAQQGDAFAEAGEAAGAYSDQLASISQGVNWQNMVSSLQGASQIIDGALTKVKNLATSIYRAVSAAADWADDIAAESQKAELDVETYQSWQYAAQLIDTSVETIISAQDKLLKKMTSDSTDTAETFNRLGVATRDETGALRDQNDVFWDVIDALGESTDAHGDLLTEAEKDAVAQELFGKSYRELLPLINSGSDAWDEAAEEGRKFATVSEENVAKLTALDDAQVRLNARWEKTKNTLAASVAPAFTEATDKISAAVDAFNAFLETPEGQKALDDLNDAIAGLLDVITDINFEAAFEFATKCVKALTDVLNWLIENKELVVGALIAIKGLSIGFNVAESVLKFLELVKGIKWLNVANGAKELGSALGAGGGGAGAGAGSAGADISGAAGAAGAAGAGAGGSATNWRAAGAALIKGGSFLKTFMPDFAAIEKLVKEEVDANLQERLYVPASIRNGGAFAFLASRYDNPIEIMTEAFDEWAEKQPTIPAGASTAGIFDPDWAAKQTPVYDAAAIARIFSDSSASGRYDIAGALMRGVASALAASTDEASQPMRDAIQAKIGKALESAASASGPLAGEGTGPIGEAGKAIAEAITTGAAAGVAAMSDDATATLKKSALALSPALTSAVGMITGTAETLLSQLAAIVASAGQWSGGNISMLADGYSALSSINLPGSYITAGVDTGSSGLQFVGLGRRTQYPVTGGGINHPTQQQVNVQMYIDRHEVARAVAPITAQTIAADLYATR